MAVLLKGKVVIESLTRELKNRVAMAKNVPTLAIIRVGDKPEDISYEKSAMKRADAIGVQVECFRYSQSITRQELVTEIDRINRDKGIHGVLIFRPLPDHIDESEVAAVLSPSKDIDGITPGALAGVLMKQELGFPPCTAAACMEILDYYHIPLKGKKVTVLGRSLVIGKPVAVMAMNRDATVTVCHSKTAQDDLIKASKEAEILIVSLGKAEYIGKEHVSPGQIVIDVGINQDSAGKLCGDVNFDEAEPIVQQITPVPGGVGGVTTVVLMKHVIEAAYKQSHEERLYG